MTPEQAAREFREMAEAMPVALRRANERFAEDVADEARGNVYSRVPGTRGSGRRRPSNEGSLSRTRASIRGEGTDTGGVIGIGGPSAPGALGHEFGGQGSRRSMQFPPFKGKEGYFLYPTIRSEWNDEARWERAIDEVLGE